MNTDWNLEKHFFNSINDEKITQIIEDTKIKTEEFILKWKNKIATADISEFKKFLTEYPLLFKPLSKVYCYFSYLSTLDTQDQEVLQKIGEISSLYSDLAKKLLFITEEYKLIGEDKLFEMSNSPELLEYKNSLINEANNLKYTLSEETEEALIEKSQVISIFKKIYSELTNSFEYNFKGEMMTRADVSAKRESEISDERKEAFDSINNKFGEIQNQIVLGGLYKSVCKNNVSEIKNRNYSGVMTTRNLMEEMDDDCVNFLLDTIRKNFTLYHKFLKIKAKLIGKDKLDYYDIFAPVPKPENEQEISFQNGLEFYFDKISKFDSEFLDYSKEIFEDERVSVFPRKGKQDGAYASYDKGEKSFVMLNWTNDLSSIMTMSHELGHAIHGWYSQIQPEQVYHSPLSLAETASIFNECLVFEELMKTVSNEEKNYYLCKKLDDYFSTTFRQVMYTLFERECHSRFLEGEELSYKNFNDIWYKYLVELYGDSVNLSDNMKYGWSSIPHIFKTPFYCYAYSFGNTLSFNLYQMYKVSENVDEFKANYKDILKSGGSVRPKELLAKYNIDIQSDNFYQNSFAFVENMLTQITF